MDLQKIISDLVSKLTGNKDLIAKFTANPASLIQDLLGIKLGGADLAGVVRGVGEKLGIDVSSVLKDAGGLLGKIKSIFGK